MKEKRHYTLVLVPHDAQGEPLKLRFSSRWLYGAVAVFLALIILASASLLYSAALSRRLVSYELAMKTTQEQKAEINQFSLKTALIKQALQDLANKDQELRRLLGLEARGWGLKSASLKLDTEVKSLKDVDRQIDTRRASYVELKQKVELVKARFAYTPSIWPVKGRLNSFFGYRYYPWRGFHSGLDIESDYGTPIRATASGTVQFAGWERGYGKAIIVNHGSNLTTLYGHLSKITVKDGEQVIKGQRIGLVGVTGYSTGPHLHYEVRWAGNPVNPSRYLSMNLLTASRVWNHSLY
ncbi:MAG: M23 family metallopeptidase [Candidatus Saganbacteria bacterium]|nr:M23 family metallopeptidase [Candidatus Saganbacteria bacterium]